VALDEHRFSWRALRRLADRHPRAHAERARLVARRGHDAATAATPTDDDRHAAQARIEQPLDRHEERVEIEAAHPRSVHLAILRLNVCSAQGATYLDSSSSFGGGGGGGVSLMITGSSTPSTSFAPRSLAFTGNLRSQASISSPVFGVEMHVR